MKVTVDTDLYTKWVAKGGAPQSAKELSELSGIDEAILGTLFFGLNTTSAKDLVTHSSFPTALGLHERLEAADPRHICSDRVHPVTCGARQSGCSPTHVRGRDVTVVSRG